MPGVYNLKVVTDFAAAHTLREYPGACARMHGHNWKVEAEVVATALDDAGMGVDFKVIRREIKDITERLDHQYLNDLEPFTELNPTAENIAAHIHAALSERLNSESLRVAAITLWETERACVRYSEEA